MLRDSVRSYYRSVRIEAPPEIEKREFGYSLTPFRKIETRHKSFSNEDELNRFLREEAPFYISYSVGYFKFPRATPMENKVLLGSDLVFEFDVDEVGLKSDRDVWVCESCGEAGFGWVGKCPKCGSPTRIEIFPDPEREEKLKSIVARLIDEVFIRDWGLGGDEISVNFSGNRGYHIHLRSPGLFRLSKEARVELSEYVTGQSIEPSYMFGGAVSCGRDVPFLCIKGPSPSQGGWPGRIARNVVKALREHPEVVVSVLGENEARAVLSNADMYVSLINRGLWPAPSLIPLSKWVEIARAVAPLGGFTIDTGTTVDIHRLIRLPNSVHGTTGLVASSVKNLDSFYPYRDSVVLPSKEITVRVKIAPEFELGKKTFGPFRDEEVQLPLYVAYFLIGRGVAEWSLTSRG